MGNGNDLLDDGKYTVVLVGIASAAFVTIIYHCLGAARYFLNRYHLPAQHQQQHQQQAAVPRPHLLTEIVVTRPVGIQKPTAHVIIPAHKYQKGVGGVGGGGGGGGDDGITCAVCLCEFEEGEELRTLPECLHAYHAPCIDMWLYSHSNCPTCRTDATPSSRIFKPRVSAGSGDIEGGT